MSANFIDTPEAHTPPDALVAKGDAAVAEAGYESDGRGGWWRRACPALYDCCGGACSWCGGGKWARPLVQTRPTRRRGRAA